MSDSLFELPPSVDVEAMHRGAVKESAFRARKRSYLAVAFAMQSPDGLAEVRSWGFVSRHTLLRAALHLRMNGHEHAAMVLNEHAQTIHPRKRTGKPRVRPGVRRSYRVQRQDGVDFARIPTETLGLGRGDSVEAEFAPDGKTITLRALGEP